MTDQETIQLLETHLFTAPLKLIVHDAKEASKKSRINIIPKNSIVRIEANPAFPGGVGVRRLVRFISTNKDNLGEFVTKTYALTSFSDFIKESARKAAEGVPGRLAVSGILKLYGKRVDSAMNEAAEEISKHLIDGRNIILKPSFSRHEEGEDSVILSIFRYKVHEKDINTEEFIEEILGSSGKSQLKELFKGFS